MSFLLDPVVPRGFILTSRRKKRKPAPVENAFRQELAINAKNAMEWRYTMATKRKIELFSAGCPACEGTIQLVNRIACPSCEVSILDMNEPDVSDMAKSLGIRTVTAVVLDGKLLNCCAASVADEQALRTAGVGKA